MKCQIAPHPTTAQRARNPRARKRSSVQRAGEPATAPRPPSARWRGSASLETPQALEERATPPEQNAGGDPADAPEEAPAIPDIVSEDEAADEAPESPAPDENASGEAIADDAPALETRVLANSPIRAALVELNGREDGRVTLLRLAPGERALIGRTGDGLTLRLGYDQWVSSSHAEVWIDADDAWWLMDKKSRNGTQLQRDKDPIPPEIPVSLRIGDIFRVGHTDLLLTDQADLLHAELEQA